MILLFKKRKSVDLYWRLLFILLIRNVRAFVCVDSCECTGQKINCTNRDLMTIPHFETINGANYVDLSYNEIEAIEEDEFNWNGIEQLQFLYIKDNSLVYIAEQALNTFRNLEYLDLSNNHLQYIPSRMFSSNVKLTTVLLAGNVLSTQIPIIHSETIQRLDLSFNKLTHFADDNVQHLPNLNSLSLQGNNLKYLNPTIFARHTTLHLTLNYNFWACNCSTIDVYEWARANSDRIVIDDPMHCLNKNGLFVNIANRAGEFKEQCDIDEDSFGVETIKNLSQTKSDNDEKNATADDETSSSTSSIDRPLIQRIDEATIFIGQQLLIFAAAAIVVTSLAIAIGVFIGMRLSRRSFQDQEWTI